MHTHGLLQVVFVLLGVELGAKTTVFRRCELCVRVHRHGWERGRWAGDLSKKLNFPGESLKQIPWLRCGLCLCLVSNGEHSTPEMPFVIHLLSAEQQPPLFQTAAPLLEVTRGGRATIGE